MICLNKMLRNYKKIELGSKNENPLSFFMPTFRAVFEHSHKKKYKIYDIDPSYITFPQLNTLQKRIRYCYGQISPYFRYMLRIHLLH